MKIPLEFEAYQYIKVTDSIFRWWHTFSIYSQHIFVLEVYMWDMEFLMGNTWLLSTWPCGRYAEIISQVVKIDDRIDKKPIDFKVVSK